LSGREQLCEPEWLDLAQVKQVLQCPERQLGVVGRQSNALAAGMPIWQVVAYLAVSFSTLAGQLALGGVAKRVTNCQAEEHSADPIFRSRLSWHGAMHDLR